MELKEGYKQTEVGVIPGDWEVRKLGEFVKITSGESPSHFMFSDEGTPYFKVEQLNNGNKYLFDTPYHSEFRSTVPKGSLIFPKRGASILLNKIRILVEDSFMDTNLMTLTLSEGVDNEFMFYALLHKELWRIADTTSIPQINNKHIIPFQIPLPPTKAEQTAIATTLSDADALIQSLEKLIAKKRLIKHGAMQELLKPKEDWMVKRLGTFLDYVQPTKYLVIDTEYNDNNYTPVLTAGKTFILGYTNEEFGIYKDNLPVIIFDDFTTATKYVDFPFKAKSSAMKILRKKYETVNLKFIFEIIQQINYPLGDHKRHWIAEYQNIEIRIPKPEEQTRIATILSDMDAEISALESKLAKYKQVKQGMMQELLGSAALPMRVAERLLSAKTTKALSPVLLMPKNASSSMAPCRNCSNPKMAGW